jgi:Sulfotransferase domain
VGQEERDGMLVICNGMPRSASTWAFNAAVGLLRRSDPDAELYSGYDESVARFLETAPPSATNLVVKCHELDARGKALAQAAKARTIYTWRDPADAVVSCMGMFDYDFERALTAIESSFKLYLFHRLRGTALILSYVDIVDNPVEAVAGIAGYLGLDGRSEVVAAVAEDTSLERMKEQSRQLEASAYDPTTLLHPGHVRDGGVGYGREALTPEQLRHCDALVQRYVRHPRRTHALHRAAGAARMVRGGEVGLLGVRLRDAVFGSRR